MSDAEPTLPYLAMRVVFEDLPDLIQIETRVVDDDWQGRATAYGKPSELHAAARKLFTWSARPEGNATIELGYDTGVGWLHVCFYEKNMAGALACYIQMTASETDEARTAKPRKIAIEMRVEAGLVERFARDLARISEEYPEAILNGIK